MITKISTCSKETGSIRGQNRIVASTSHCYSWIRRESAPSLRLQLSSRLISEPKDQTCVPCRTLCLRLRFTWMKRRERRFVTLIRRYEFDVSNRSPLKPFFDLECSRRTSTLWLRLTVVSSSYPLFRRAAVDYETRKHRSAIPDDIVPRRIRGERVEHYHNSTQSVFVDYEPLHEASLLADRGK